MQPHERIRITDLLVSDSLEEGLEDVDGVAHITESLQATCFACHGFCARAWRFFQKQSFSLLETVHRQFGCPEALQAESATLFRVGSEPEKPISLGQTGNELELLLGMIQESVRQSSSSLLEPDTQLLPEVCRPSNRQLLNIDPESLGEVLERPARWIATAGLDHAHV